MIRESQGEVLDRFETPFAVHVGPKFLSGGRFVFVTGDEPSRLRPGYWMARAFNAAQPRLRIGPESIKASMQARRRARARAKHGAFLNRKLGERYDFAGE